METRTSHVIGRTIPVLVLEIPNLATFAWRYACAGAGGLCTVFLPDLYPQGVTSLEGLSGFESVGDFGFRTYAGEMSELPLTQGDNDCDGDADSVDALKGLQHVAAIGFSQEPGCPAIGSKVASLFGDVDGDDDVDSVDGLKILQSVAAIPFTQNEPCTRIGDPLT